MILTTTQSKPVRSPVCTGGSLLKPAYTMNISVQVHHHLQAPQQAMRPGAMQVNMRGELDAAMKQRHSTAPDVVQWHAGVLLPPDVSFSSGTWSPRHEWR